MDSTQSIRSISWFTLVIIVLCSLAMPAASQQVLNADNLRNVQVDKLTDEEITAYYQKAKSTGLSDEQLLRMAADRGMPADQIAKLKERLMLLSTKTTSSPNGAVSQKEPVAKSEDKVSPEAMKPTVAPVLRDSSIFGAELFEEASTVFAPNFKIATPAGYVLGPGDELQVQVFGYSEQTYNLLVNAEGFVYIPNVGPILVSGLPVEEASEKIKNRLAATIYKAIRSGQTRVQVTLGKIKSIGITVIGQATKPGTYTVPSLTTVFNLLYLCGGPSNQGSFRKIELIRGNKVYRVIDLYSFLLRGDKMDNVLLRDQDVVRIPYYGTRVSISGQVRRPGKFEMLRNESLDQLMTYSGGFADDAYKAMVKVVRMSDTGRLLTDVPVQDFGSFVPQTGDAFSVGKSPNKYNNRITIKGAVLREDDYELKPGMQLKALLDLAGLKQDAYIERGLISRVLPDQTITSLSFNIRDVLLGKEQIPLQKDDIISISSIYDLKEALTIEVKGEVRAPSKYVYQKNLKLKDLLLQAGGFTEVANLEEVEISRRLLNQDVQAASYQQAELIKVDVTSGIEGEAGNILLQPFDVVIVRARGNYERQRTVFLAGQVYSPGSYVLQTSKERISMLMMRAGGFKSSADSSSISIRRVAATGLTAEERQRAVEKLLSIDRDTLLANPALRETYLRSVDFLSVNVEKIKENPGGPEDVILEDGDYIEVARSSSLVRVSGEVYHTNLLPYKEGASARYYIKQSGNYTHNARRKKTFVVYPDGRAKAVKSFLFFRSYPTVTARSEVFVPSKKQDEKKGLSTTEWIALSTIVATLATLAITVLNTTK